MIEEAVSAKKESLPRPFLEELDGWLADR